MRYKDSEWSEEFEFKINIDLNWDKIVDECNVIAKGEKD